ncbi:hypothetical protein FQA39_LY12973 [Lamprigera yunnana]|nr:hypothetical protein FQA39_LY12973 [Lamprigera yunnana]
MEVVSGANNLDGTINVYGLNRAGLELAGYFAQNKDPKTKQTRTKKYKDLLNSGSPLIIVTQKFTDDLLFAVANEQNFPVVRVNAPSTNEISQQILDYYDEIFAPSEEVHASLLNIFGKGVLIQGESGIGKSEVSIELIKNNHLFVGDDRIILTHKGGKVYGKSHPVLEHLVEVRGIGIIDLSKTLGYQVMMYETPIDIVIELTKFKEGGIDTTDRLGND